MATANESTADMVKRLKEEMAKKIQQATLSATVPTAATQAPPPPAVAAPVSTPAPLAATITEAAKIPQTELSSAPK